MRLVGGGRAAGLIRTVCWSVLVLAAVGAALLTGALQPVDDILSKGRFAIVDRAASQTLTVVEIDSRSLRAGDSWPWDRERYAQAIDRLTEAGAVLVAFDVDLSAASTSRSDQALAAAIARRPGQVALASFVQNDTYGAPSSAVVENTPRAEFRRDALLASVNVPVDQDGQVRRYEAAPSTSSQPSIAALMAGSQSTATYAIDFGIDHRSVPHISFEDILTGNFDRKLVEGRVVLVGATALELGDEFATPVGLVPGVYIHALAYESLVGGRTLMRPGPITIMALCALMAALLLPQRQGGRRGAWLVVRHVISAASLIVVPIAVQFVSPVSVPIGALVVTQLCFAIWATRVELDRRAQAIVTEREGSLLHLAMHQPETELPNRRALLKVIEDAWAARPQADVSVITVGVERHAEMRGVVGYNVANNVIVQLARRLSDLSGARCVAQISTSVLAFAREDLGSDELVELLARLGDLETNFEIDGNSIDIFTCMGAARHADGPISPALLVERATVALNEARQSEERALIYDEARFNSPANNLALMSEMRRAMTCGDISLHYQPKMTAADGRVTSVEALCRWRHPERGPIAPDVFIPIAEETGQIRALTEWSLHRAIADQTKLRAAGHEVVIALNVSGRLLVDEAFKAKVLEVLAESDAKLCFEITETAVIQHPALATDAIAAYRAAGVKVSIDDYGSGLSSLGYLKLLDADELKMDRSLVVDVMNSQRDRLIMKSTVDLAHSLGMSVVAEGVETEALGACLALLGVDIIQGYWFSRPLPLSQLAEFLDARVWALEQRAAPENAIPSRADAGR